MKAFSHIPVLSRPQTDSAPAAAPARPADGTTLTAPPILFYAKILEAPIEKV